MVKIDGRVPDRGDIIQLELNPRTGSEQAGYRPAIIISPLLYNQISNIVLVCPITSRKKGWPFEVELPDQMQTYGVILVDQIRAVDCIARKAVFVEKAPTELIDEVIARLEPLLF
ncbi:type II toxin-antitoxin system PemK/MazF family toxin [Calothrix membranacea FACHB-236]|nr:type II toxin-antitoxin system PemK/MazF family toxin [Calothrix membranacea FACHB-236]